jgi:hypothetical protein
VRVADDAMFPAWSCSAADSRFVTSNVLPLSFFLFSAIYRTNTSILEKGWSAYTYVDVSLGSNRCRSSPAVHQATAISQDAGTSHLTATLYTSLGSFQLRTPNLHRG